MGIIICSKNKQEIFKAIEEELNNANDISILVEKHSSDRMSPSYSVYTRREYMDNAKRIGTIKRN